MKGRRRLKAKRTYGNKEASGGAGLYVYTFPSQRGKKVKIGCSGRDVERRIRQQISHTSIPEIAEVELIVFIRDAEALEKDLHRLLRSRRVVDTFGSKEWFSISSVDELLQIAPALRLACTAAEQGKMSYLAAQDESAKEEQLRKKNREELEAKAQRIANLMNNLSELRTNFTNQIDGSLGINRRKIFVDDMLGIYAIKFIVLSVLSIPAIFVFAIEYWIFGTYYAVIAMAAVLIFGPISFSAFSALSASENSFRRKEKLILEEIENAKQIKQSHSTSHVCLDPKDKNRLGSMYDTSKIGSHNLIERLGPRR